MRHNHVALWSLIMHVMRNLVRRSFRRRSMNMVMMKMAVWFPRLSMYLLLRLRSRTGPLLHPQRQTQIKDKLLLRGRLLQGKNLPGVFKWITQLRGSLGTSTNVLHDPGFKTILISLILLLLLLLSPKTLDTHYLITIQLI
jgi:hypothetical protein